MVRYSIEAGLLGPGVRTMLGGAVRAGAARRRRMDTPQGKHLRDRSAADRQYPGHSHRRRNGGGLCDRLCGLCAVRFPGARNRLHPARAGGAGHARRGAAAWAGARRSRHRRRLRHARSWSRPNKPDFWALYIYLAIVTAAAFGLARIRLWRWLAVTTIAFALLWTFPCLQCGPSMVAPHAFHVMAGFVLAALLVVCGFMFGPPADEGQIEPISSGSLAAYLFGATLIVLNSFHADTAMIVFGAAGGRHPARRLAQRCRRRRGRRRGGASSSSCLPNGRSAPIRTCWCCPADRCRASGRTPRTDRCRCI